MEKPQFAVGTGMPQRERFRMCEVPQRTGYFFHPPLPPHHGLSMPIALDQVFAALDAARFLRSTGAAMGTARKYPSFIKRNASK